SSRGTNVTTARYGPLSVTMSSVSATVVLAVDVDGKRSVMGSVPRICRTAVVFPAPVVPSRRTRRYPSSDVGSGSIASRTSEDGYRRVLLLGTTGAGKTTAVRQ